MVKAFRQNVFAPNLGVSIGGSQDFFVAAELTILSFLELNAKYVGCMPLFLVMLR